MSHTRYIPLHSLSNRSLALTAARYDLDSDDLYTLIRITATSGRDGTRRRKRRTR